MRILLSVLLVLLLVPAWSGQERLALLGREARIAAVRVPLDPGDPTSLGKGRKVGRLTWLGGVHLTSPDPSFGGFSAIRVTRRGADNRFTLISDGGNVVHFTLDSRLRLRDPVFAELPDGPGTGWQKRQRDSESLAVDPATGDVWVGFENADAIWRFDAALATTRRHVRPPTMRHWNENGGPEAMALLPDGGMVAISETSFWGDVRGRAAIRFAGDPTLRPRDGFRFGYVPPRGYDPSDAAMLPDGRLLVLNRRFALPFEFSAKLTVVDLAAIRRGAAVRGREIATLAAPLIHDNFEGIAITREGRDTIVWIVSDDNQMMLERTLLLKFRLEPGA